MAPVALNDGSRKGLVGFGGLGSFGCLTKALACGVCDPHSPRSDTSGADCGRVRASPSSSSTVSTCVGSEDSELDTPTATTSLERIMRTLAAEPWPAGRFDRIAKLQDAVRNRGTVDLMFDSGGLGKVAVKKMPNTWVQADAAAFASRSSSANEQPWFDLAVVEWLNSKSFAYSCALHGIFRDESSTYVVFELATEGDLLSWCQKLLGPGEAREKAIRPVAQKMCSAMAWLHELGIAHRDLSLENVLLTRGAQEEELQIKLIDFGMATTQRFVVDEVRGKASYQAPEMHSKHVPYDPFISDVFAMGVAFFSLGCDGYPWLSTAPGVCQFWHLVAVRDLRTLLGRRTPRNGQPGQLLTQVLSASYIDLLEGMLTVKPGNRLTFGACAWGEDDMVPKKADGGKSSVWDMPWMQVFPH